MKDDNFMRYMVVDHQRDYDRSMGKWLKGWVSYIRQRISLSISTFVRWINLFFFCLTFIDDFFHGYQNINNNLDSLLLLMLDKDILWWTCLFIMSRCLLVMLIFILVRFKSKFMIFSSSLNLIEGKNNGNSPEDKDENMLFCF